ncbi:MAG: glycosyltransferase family 4 protein [Fimbriiglobus sp.]
MKVLHLYAGNMFGGIERFLITLAKLRHLAPEMEPEYGLCFRGQLWDDLQKENVPVHDLGAVRFSRPWTVLKARRALTKLLSGKRYDVVVCHAAWPHAVFASTVKRFQVRVVTFAHDTWAGRHWVERWAKRTLPDLVLANSHFTLKTVQSLFPSVNNACLYLPVSPISRENQKSLKETVRLELNTSPEHVVPIFCARLEPWKGPHIFIEALAKLKHIPNWTGWLVGGPQTETQSQFFQTLKGMSQELGVYERIRFLGLRKDVENLLLAADFHCQPNTAGEPFGVAFVEALGAGLPLVTSEIGGAIEIVTPDCGILTKSSNASATAEGIARLIETPSERSRLAAHATRRADELCNPSRQINAFCALLKVETAANQDSIELANPK